MDATTPPTRSSGILLHPTALPGSPVCGTFGEPSRRWVDLLADNNIGLWQLLPLAPPDQTGSPYSSPSCFALNPWLLDAQDLREEGYISPEHHAALPGAEAPSHDVDRLDFALATQRSEALAVALLQAWPQQSSSRHAAFQSWCSNQNWLEDHARYSVLHGQFEGPWWTWPQDLAAHRQAALISWSQQNGDALLRIKLEQWHLDRQWQAIRELAKERGVLLFGDLPFYVSADSADVWSHRTLFTIKENGELTTQSGVPPDYFLSLIHI